MSFSDNMLLIRKKKELSQADLGKMIGTSGDVVGRYGRGGMDKQALKRLEDISNLPDENKKFVLTLRDFKVKKAHAS